MSTPHTWSSCVSTLWIAHSEHCGLWKGNPRSCVCSLHLYKSRLLLKKLRYDFARIHLNVHLDTAPQGATATSMADSEPQSKSPGESSSSFSSRENLSNEKHQRHSDTYDKDLYLPSEIEKTSLNKHTKRRGNDFAKKSHHHHHQRRLKNNTKTHKGENFYDWTFPKTEISHRKNGNLDKDHLQAPEEPATYLQESNIKYPSNNFEDLNAPESQPALRSGPSQHKSLPKLKNKHTLKKLKKDIYQKNDLRKHSGKHFSLINKKTESDPGNTFDNKKKKHHKFGHEHRKENDINNHLHNHKRSHHYNLGANKKKHFLLNSSRHIRLVNSSKKHRSKSKYKDGSTKKTSHKVKNPKYSIHGSSSNHTKKGTRDHILRKLKKHSVHGIRLNQLRKRRFRGNCKKRAKHLGKPKHLGKKSLKENRIVVHHGHNSKNSPKFLKEMTKKLLSEKMSKHSLHKLLKKYFSKAGKKYYKDILSKKLYKKFSRWNLPDHAIVEKDENVTKDSEAISEETTMKPTGSDYITNADTSISTASTSSIS